MSTTRKRDRIVALSVAIFFFALASALSILVIYQLVTTKNNQTASTSSSQTASTTLEGTQLTGFTPVSSSSVTKLEITDIKVGTGAVAKAGDTVTVDYTGAIASTGIIFQSTKDSGAPVSLNLNSVIPGWKLGIPGMKVGGERQLLIPASEAYGANPPSGSGIPANAALVFEITLDKIGS